MKNETILSRFRYSDKVRSLLILFAKAELSRAHLPTRVGKYVLLYPAKKVSKYRPFGTGIYVFKGKKYFIKTWKGSVRDFRYSNLVNEYIANKSINAILSKTNHNVKIKVPYVIDVISSKNSLSLVIDYVEAKSLSNERKSVQEKVIADVLNDLLVITSRMSKEDRKNFQSRSTVFYFFLLPLFLMISILQAKKHKCLLLKKYYKVLLSFISLHHADLHLSHGDLTPDNILVRDDTYFLLDLEHMKLTVPGYDMNDLSLHPKFSDLVNGIHTSVPCIENEFLKTYIASQYYVSTIPKSMKNSYFRHMLST